MPLTQTGVAVLAGAMPKVISPRNHAIADYVAVGGLLLMGALFWKNNRRAAVASLSCAGAEAANTLLTDFPGGVTKTISFPTHGRIDMGLAAACSALPNFLGFDDSPEAKYFRMMGISITTVAALTNFKKPVRRKLRIRKTA